MNHLRTDISSYFYLALIHALGVFPELLHLLFEQLTERLLCLQTESKQHYDRSADPNPEFNLDPKMPHSAVANLHDRTLQKHRKYFCNPHPWL